MNRLMEHAREMVSLSKAITDKLRARKGEITDDEVSEFHLQFFAEVNVCESHHQF